MPEICHVCRKKRKPYVVIMTDNPLSVIKYLDVREPGPICERCDRYYAMTGEFREASTAEFRIAEKSAWFANMMLKWWEKDEKLSADIEEEDKRNWGGTEDIARWCREHLSKKGLGFITNIPRGVRSWHFKASGSIGFQSAIHANLEVLEMNTEEVSWAFDEFSSADLGDERRTERLIKLASALAKRPTASFPEAFGMQAELTAAYRFYDNDQIDPDDILASHTHATMPTRF